MAKAERACVAFPIVKKGRKRRGTVVTGSRGNPAGARLTVRAVPHEQRRKGKEEDIYGIVVRVTHGGIKGGWHLITSI
jgi:hypothetical protein